MSDQQATPTIEMARLTFGVGPDRRAEIENFLDDLGLDVYVQGEGRFTVIWEEPGRDASELVEELWAINGGPFDVTSEEFSRRSLLVYHADDEAVEAEEGRAVA